MLLQGARRGSQAPKRWCLAEECHGASPEACRALRDNEALASLVEDASQSSPQWWKRGTRRGQRTVLPGHGHTGPPALPGLLTGKPQSAEGAASNTPPPSCRVRLPCCTREAFLGMRREVDRRQGETRDDIPLIEERGGWGVGVRGRSRRPHGESSPRRRPLALGSTEYKEEAAHKVPSERVSGPREFCFSCLLVLSRMR